MITIAEEVEVFTKLFEGSPPPAHFVQVDRATFDRLLSCLDWTKDNLAGWQRLNAKHWPNHHFATFDKRIGQFWIDPNFAKGYIN